MHYKGHEKHHHHHHRHASCDRFCRNVCDQFSSGREQCYADCKACRGNNNEEEYEGTKGTQHGWICVKAEEVEDCGNCNQEESTECDCGKCKKCKKYESAKDNSCDCW